MKKILCSVVLLRAMLFGGARLSFAADDSQH